MVTETLTDRFVANTFHGLLHSKGNPLPETTQQDIYDGEGNRSSIKLGKACLGLTICGTLFADTISANSISSGQTSSNTDIFNLTIQLTRPIGSLYLTTTSSIPFPNSGTTWEQINAKFLVGVGQGYNTINGNIFTFSIGELSGYYNHVLNILEIPPHTHIPLEYNTHPYFITTDTKGIVASMGTADFGGRPITAPPGVFGFPGTSPLAQTLKMVGSNIAHNNIMPNYGVYIWKRTA